MDQTATLVVSLLWEGDARTVALEDAILPVVRGADVTNRSTTVETRWEAGQVWTTVRHEFTLVPREAGRVTVDSLRIGWVVPASGARSHTWLPVQSLQVVRRPPGVGTLLRHPGRSALGAALVAAGIVALVWLRRRAADVEPTTELSPEALLERDTRALTALARRGELGPFSERASQSLRRFVGARYGIATAHLPGPAIGQALEEANAPTGVVRAVEDVLAFVDDVKFGLRVPTHAELENILRNMETLGSEWADTAADAGP